MIKDIIGYGYPDLTIIPSVVSHIDSRTECDPYINGMLPIFTAPMNTVVNLETASTYENEGIIPVLPRTEPLETRMLYCNNFWTAFSLSEFEDLFVTNAEKYLGKYADYFVCVDIANGHMAKLHELCTKAKLTAIEHNCNLFIMTGNIANPETYRLLCSMCIEPDIPVIDYIRLSIGSGSQCLTAPNTGVHYPIATLINECRKIKNIFSAFNPPKIIADGGIRNYGDVIKALALGADYVMIGGLFASLYESASPLLNAEFKQAYTCDTEEDKRMQIASDNYYKECYGMSTKKAQSLIGKTTRTSEGKYSYVPVKYTLHQWVDNMEDLLKSAMSYCNCRTLKDFIGNQTLIPNGPGELSYVNK